MISIDYSSVGPGFEAVLLARCQSLQQSISREPFELKKLGGDQRLLRMQVLQGRRLLICHGFMVWLLAGGIWIFPNDQRRTADDGLSYCITRQAA
jgi:hypothetical protein